MKKRLTFSFLPWAAAAGACIGGGFAHGQEPAAPVPADGSVLVAGEDEELVASNSVHEGPLPVLVRDIAADKQAQTGIL